MEVLGPWFGSFLIMIKRSIGDYTNALLLFHSYFIPFPIFIEHYLLL